jgi:hypothetical protein
MRLTSEANRSGNLLHTEGNPGKNVFDVHGWPLSQQ